MIESNKIPLEYSVWCFRIVLDKNKMFSNNIVIDEIKASIETNHDMYVITHSMSNKSSIGEN